MALATQCPHCQTIFRVAHDQLKLRAGLVRCGTCKEIFNGIENLLRSEDTPTAAAITDKSSLGTPTGPTAATSVMSTMVPTMVPTITTTSALAAITASEAHATDRPLTPDIETSAAPLEKEPGDSFPAVFFEPPAAPSPGQAAAALDPTETAALPLSTERPDPLDRMTLIHVSDDIDHLPPDHAALGTDHVIASDDAEYQASLPSTIAAGSGGLLVQPDTHETADELDQAIDYLQRKPWRGSKKNVSRKDVEGPLAFDRDGDDKQHTGVPGFVARSRNAQRRRGVLRKFQYAAAALLITTVIAQSAYLLRDQLAARLPESRPALASLCNLLGCRVGLPAQIDMVSIESNELLATPSLKNNFSLNLLLRNRSDLPQRWPALELTLLDGNDRPLVRRVFSPSDYLPTALNVTAGFARNSEQSTRLTFVSPQQKAANYRVVLFYP